jgi:serine/threonine-protein kinase
MVRLFQPGDGLGGYRIARLLGAGGFAEVYEAIDPSGVRRALKILSADASRGPRIRTGLAREADALARIEHVNVVRFYEAGIEEDHVYLILELVEGVTLAEKMSDPVALAPLEDVVRWIYQACEGVAEAHRVGVIHRDLKPANILVTPSGVVKVIDFGIAKLRRWSSASTGEHLVGTALYMAPEQLHAQPSDARADVYSMGVILYEALAGVHPLDLRGGASTVFQVFQQHLVGEPRPLRDVAPEVPAALAELVHEALAKDPGRRMPTMQALADGLHAVLLEMIAERRAVSSRSSSPSGEPGFAPFSLPPSARSIRPPVEERSPLAVTDAMEPGRSAFPPPPPREGASSVPPSPHPPAPPQSAADDGGYAPKPPLRAPAAPVEPSRSSASVPRGSSAMPVVAETGHDGARIRPLPRRALPAVVAAIVIALAALFWGANRHRWMVVPVPPASAVAPSPVELLDAGKATATVADHEGKLYGASPVGAGYGAEPGSAGRSPIVGKKGFAASPPAGSAKSQLTYTGPE